MFLYSSFHTWCEPYPSTHEPYLRPPFQVDSTNRARVRYAAFTLIKRTRLWGRVYSHPGPGLWCESLLSCKINMSISPTLAENVGQLREGVNERHLNEFGHCSLIRLLLWTCLQPKWYLKLRRSPSTCTIICTAYHLKNSRMLLPAPYAAVNWSYR